MIAPIDRYSADVKLRLEVGGRMLDVAQLGPTQIILRDRIDSPATDAILYVTVDGKTRRRKVYLPHGLTVNDTESLYW